MPPTDTELVAAALGGSQEAYRDLVVRFERPVYGLVLRMVQDPATAEDLAQDVFVKAFRALATYDPARKFASWLFKIAHNTTIDHLRRPVVDTVPIEAAAHGDAGELPSLLERLVDAQTESPSAAAERRELARALEAAIATLRPEHREAVVLFYLEGASYQEICETMELPLGTIKTHLHRARKELAERMRGSGWGGGGAGASAAGGGASAAKPHSAHCRSDDSRET